MIIDFHPSLVLSLMIIIIQIAEETGDHVSFKPAELLMTAPQTKTVSCTMLFAACNSMMTYYT